MALSSDALDIIAYLETVPGEFVSMGEISRKAGGRRRFERNPAWARGQMAPLVDAGVVEINSNGHYRVPSKVSPPPENDSRVEPAAPKFAGSRDGMLLGDDYFPATGDEPSVVGDDYFPGVD